MSATIPDGLAALLVSRPRLFQTIVWHSRHPWRSATIVPDNRLALAPSLAVGHDCCRQSFGTRAIPGGRLQQSILLPGALLSRRSDRLVVDALILTAALTTDIGEVGIAHQLAREHHDLMTDAKRRLHSDHELDPQLVAFAIERLLRSRAPRAQPVPLEQEWQLPLQFPEEGMGAEAALAHIGDLALDGAAQLYHPGYFAHMDPPTATVTSLAALWQATANQNLLHPDAAPAARALEQRVIEWLAPCFGMGGGHLVPGSTIATFTAIWAARELRGVRRVVASERAHLSARKAADILGLGYQPVPSDVTHRMLSAELGDLSDAALVVTAGTVATGAIDALDVSGAGWLHVDGAWGGPLRFSQRHRALLDGIEHADSVGFSAHKWCYQPKGTAVVLFRDAEPAHQAMSYGGGYLAAPNIGLLGSAPANALPFAATLLAWGRKGLAARIDAGMEKAAQLAELVAADSRFELWGTPITGVVVWRPTKAAAADVRSRLSDAWVSLTDLDGEIWLRSVAANLSADPSYVFQRVVAALPP